MKEVTTIAYDDGRALGPEELAAVWGGHGKQKDNAAKKAHEAAKNAGKFPRPRGCNNKAAGC
jgi:hypothetical protein